MAKFYIRISNMKPETLVNKSYNSLQAAKRDVKAILHQYGETIKQSINSKVSTPITDYQFIFSISGGGIITFTSIHPEFNATYTLFLHASTTSNDIDVCDEIASFLTFGEED